MVKAYDVAFSNTCSGLIASSLGLCQSNFLKLRIGVHRSLSIGIAALPLGKRGSSVLFEDLSWIEMTLEVELIGD